MCFVRAVFTAWIISSALLGCATYQAQVDVARQNFLSDPQKAVEILEPLAAKEGRDQLVYMLDYATALQHSGRYEDSIKIFLKAEALADKSDYHSISNVAASLALNEEMVQYKGDDFEKVLINGMNALNFLELGQLDEALVEVKRVNEKLYKLKLDGKNEFNQSPYAFYLGAMIWEADRKFDDAYIAYKNTYDVAPEFAPLREDLIRSAIRADRPEEVSKWKKTFPEVAVKPEWRDRKMGEIIFLFQQGWGPRKRPRREAQTFPELVAVPSQTTAARITVTPLVTGKVPEVPKVVVAETIPIYSVQDVAIKALNEDYSRLVASRIAGVATKAVLSDQLRQKNEVLGQLALFAMLIADRADLRQWSTLPSTFQVVRFLVKAGAYLVSANSAETKMPPRDVTVAAGKKVFLTWRTVD